MPNESSHDLDLRGTLCPMNFVRIKLELDKLAPGTVLRVTADGGGTGRDIVRSLESQGFLVSCIQLSETEARFDVHAPAH